MKRLLPLLLTLTPGMALAHAGHETGSLATGFAHPLGGADHLLAMLALGLLAAQAGGRALWLLPVTFVGAMLAGGVAGAAGIGFPAVEPVILASVIILGALVGFALRLPLTAMAAMAAVFGFAHGWAHGAEGPTSGLAIYALGFAAATMALHIVGIAAGRVIPSLSLRVLGAGTALGGLALGLAG
ncbi:HupE/UreJ family protein [Paracoccus zhejiangensis]|uniref:Urease accessory protein n=1 Tax=Paracoccus zhejiangensis TaxID=1077935 RepID=A0A2H5EVP3_9RHOB|nr:HupE/UreJ family protein [Paracoccus zhejiangensis]AUH63376.1 urease accessory protein [Paracoccus zhejiangensis]